MRTQKLMSSSILEPLHLHVTPDVHAKSNLTDVVVPAQTPLHKEHLTGLVGKTRNVDLVENGYLEQFIVLLRKEPNNILVCIIYIYIYIYVCVLCVHVCMVCNKYTFVRILGTFYSRT